MQLFAFGLRLLKQEYNLNEIECINESHKNFFSIFGIFYCTNTPHSISLNVNVIMIKNISVFKCTSVGVVHIMFSE